jgi:hypothetical protein
MGVCYRDFRHLPLQLPHMEMYLVKTTHRLLGRTTFSTFFVNVRNLQKIGFFATVEIHYVRRLNTRT